jgi:hypothetical protein
MSESFNADVYIFLPMLRSAEAIPPAEICSEELREFIKTMDETAEFECRRDINKQIERRPLETLKIGIDPDACSEDDVLAFAEADIAMVLHKNSPLILATLIFKRVSFDITSLLDQMSVGELSIKSGETLAEYFYRNYKCRTVGDGKALVCISEKPGADIMSMLSGEEYNRSRVAYNPRPEALKQESTENLAQYDFYECYASRRTVIYVLPSMRGKSFSDNLNDEAAMVFIMELLMFRHNAIESVGAQVLSNLAETRKLKLKDIEELYINFGRTLIFWEKENYKYAGAQRLADSIAGRFEFDAEQESFYRKLGQIEHIVELRNSQQTEREGKIINAIAIFLAFLQVAPFLTNLFTDMELPYWTMLPGLGVLTVFFLAVFFARRRRKKNN